MVHTVTRANGRLLITPRRRWRAPAWAIGVGAAALLGAAAGSGNQVWGQAGSAGLVGTVRAAETGEPLVGAIVAVGEGEAERRAATDDEGRFRLTELDPGRIRVQVQYLGRSSGGVEVQLRTGRMTEVELALEVEPVALPELRVEVERQWRGKLAGFWQRRQRGIGHHLTPEEIEGVPGNQLHLAFRELPGVRVVQCDPRTGPPSCYVLDSGRSLPSLGGTVKCRVQYWVDGMRLPLDELPRGINEIPKHDVAALEVYTGASQIPAQYGGSDARCGVVVIWTRER